MWSSNEIRSLFLKYYEERGHTVVESSSLVPVNDPTLLFTNAGMNQFKDVFLGIDTRNYVRAATSQKCVRAGGKHNDLDTVGRTARHHTFFEMLGNFSFGDYFKGEAIGYAWGFLTEVVSLPKERLWVTIYEDDDEADRLWREASDVNPERIVRMGEKDNFWSMGDTGPCGPCSEIHYDRGAAFSCGPDCGLGRCDCDRWLEVWNLVFMQYDRDQAGKLTPLPRPSIDTGMGLERLASLLQGVDSNFDTDLFVPIIQVVEELAGQKYERGEKGFPFRVIADHSRAGTFLIADGVLPGNDGRGYVLRRILRRALRFGRRLGIEGAFLYQMVEVVCQIMGEAYPYLLDKKDFVQEVIRREEERFLTTLNEGLKRAEEIIAAVKDTGKGVIPGEDVFVLYDTYGFPLDLSEDLAEENGLQVDRDGFNRQMEEQRQRARSAGKGGNAFAREVLLSELLAGTRKTHFSGYDTFTQTSKILALVHNDQLQDKVSGGEVMVVTASTPFYAASGGQVADRGFIKGKKGTLTVEEVQRVSGWIIHAGQLQGTISKGENVELNIDGQQRVDTARHHSATHLLHRALRSVLGEHAQQKGSLVEPGRLRFDFSHLAALTEEELAAIEMQVNQAVWQAYPVKTLVTSLEEARKMGAMALFGEKYGDEVRVVQMGDYSRELCGGTHVGNTGEIGLFKIVSEGSIGSGLRRIEALTGRAALNHVKQMEDSLKELAVSLKSTPGDVPRKVESLNRLLKEREKEIERLKAELNSESSQDLVSAAVDYSGVKIVIAATRSSDVASLRQHAEMLKDKLGSSVVLLGAVIDEKVSLICFVSKDLTGRGLHAGKIVSTAARVTGGGGGGRPDMAQAGGKDPSRLEEALAAARKWVENTLQGSLKA